MSTPKTVRVEECAPSQVGIYSIEGLKTKHTDALYYNKETGTPWRTVGRGKWLNDQVFLKLIT